ncbi:conserved hypothetical protein [Talaromyces stipitatus ATCC 10500]|uniref:Uncharacterized protein n=1 Tax=Talaromyces stipitatus (strain ATCC 10500 / CBS 375.48 / QM 6759 / NRRL 1006) TaxID=441959 RepID=B8M8C7_TALSN|nr:uncharacterized protein TSTA_036640 [Talaromyces stipitatus ATCC 10500]EED20440.1 conserved hypothetical protein [Talaromyces stipitatus ATCC 10500]
MPDLEVVGTLDGPLDRPLLKGHKTLPRRRQARPTVEINDDDTPYTKTKDDMVNGDIPITPTLPLTPPNQVQEDTQDSPPRLNGQPSVPLSLRNMTELPTGSHQFSPPTPDVTPPRVKDTTPKARPVFPSLQSSMSSRADSFQTAREDMSDDDAVDGSCPSAHSLVIRKRQRSFPDPSPLSNGFDKGNMARQEFTVTGCTEKLLGTIGKDQDIKRTIRLASSPLPKSQSKGRSDQRRTVPEKANLEVASPGKKNEHSRSTQWAEPSDLDKVDGRSASELTSSEQRLMDRVNTWRHSGASFTSTIEAVVVDTSPPKPRALRHVEKRTSLRSVSSPQPRSTRTSTESNGDSSHRLVHKSGRISNQNRNSVASDMSVPVSTTSTNKEVHEVIPVVVVPQRRSSLKSSAPSITNQSAVRSTTSSRRKTSVSGSRAGDQIPPQRKHAMSDAASSTAGQSGRESRGRGVGRPPIPTRSSSLSAPTSRNNSRTTSLTSESLRLHTEQMQQAFEVPPHKSSNVLPSPRIVLHRGSDPANAGNSVPASPRRNPEDMERLHAPSLHFTQSSVVSSSPGPIEINEATMVTYFPHNNESLLVINSHMQPESRAVRALHGQDLSAPVAVSTPQHSTAMLDVESPLRNPRTPPLPPTQKAVLPDPVDSALEGNAYLSRQGSNRLSRGFGSLRRALSARRNSDGVRPQLMARSLSVRSARSRRADKARDSPFWRPRGFWDDFDSSPENERGAATPNEQYPVEREDVYVSNSLGLPQKRVIFSGPLVLARRISKSRKSRRQQARRHQLSRSDLNLAAGIVRPHSPYQRQTVKYRVQRGVLFPVRTFRNVRRRVKEARKQRARAALEARRERLKQSIGPRKVTDPYGVGPFDHSIPYGEGNARGLY